MKKILYIFVLLTIFIKLLHAYPVDQTLTANATLAVAVKITANSPLNFGTIYIRNIASGVVTLTPEGAISTTGGIAVGSGSSPASFTVSGDQAQTVNVTVSGTNLSLSGATDLNVTYTLASAVISLDSVSGTKVMKVGGILTIPTDSTVGTYNGTLTVVASY